jgi:hypothetical protein
MAQDATYQTKVYMERGGERLVVGSGGKIDVESGGQINIMDGAGFAPAGGVTIGQGAVSTVLSIINLPPLVRTVLLSGTSTMTAGSFWLTSVSAGREVFLMFCGGSTSTASGLVLVSLSGCTLLNSVGLSISTMELNNSGASYPGIMLRAIEDDVWATVSQFGDIDDAQ